jgi:hypothetical protein
MHITIFTTLLHNEMISSKHACMRDAYNIQQFKILACISQTLISRLAGTIIINAFNQHTRQILNMMLYSTTLIPWASFIVHLPPCRFTTMSNSIAIYCVTRSPMSASHQSSSPPSSPGHSAAWRTNWSFMVPLSGSCYGVVAVHPMHALVLRPRYMQRLWISDAFYPMASTNGLGQLHYNRTKPIWNRNSKCESNVI